jgi:hypothetical protein
LPAASQWFIPALALYAVWVIFRVRRHAAVSVKKPDANPLVIRLSELAARAAEKARTAEKLKAIRPPPHKK